MQTALPVRLKRTRTATYVLQQFDHTSTQKLFKMCAAILFLFKDSDIQDENFQLGFTHWKHALYGVL